MQQLSSANSWWQRGIIYQIYPRSFMDANGDGLGDLAGIADRLDYCRWLGVDAVWLSPIFPSPMVDFGYDIAEYCDVDPMFGTLADFVALLDRAHALGLKVLLDYVPNHTSDQHPWFQQSRSSRTSPYRDWYLWRDPAVGGGPPTNWLSVFGGSAWTWDDATGQYYFHSYLKQQPDLNWRNPEVHDAMFKVLRFWLDRGVDGFRVDAVSRLLKDDRFRDNPPNPSYTSDQPPYYRLLQTYSADLPEVHDIIREMRTVLDEYGDRFMIGEAYLPLERLMAYYGSRHPGVHFPFNFQLVRLPWEPRGLGAAIDAYERNLPAGAWPNWVLGNHDRHRIASRVGRAQARVAAMLLLTLRGTPTMYYGDEIGMEDVPIPPHLVQDPWEKNVPGFGLGRDPERTPMQWDPGPGAGFTSGTPWLPIADDYRKCNVAAEREDPASMLTLYRQLIQLRSKEPALSLGAYQPVGATDQTLCFIRASESRRFFVGLNMSSRPADVRLPQGTQGAVRMSTCYDTHLSQLSEAFELRPDEGVIVELR